jgi:hypothetical protein
MGLSFSVAKQALADFTYSGAIDRAVPVSGANDLVLRTQNLGNGTVIEYLPPPSDGFSPRYLLLDDIVTCENKSYPVNHSSIEGVKQCSLDLNKTKRVKILENKGILDVSGLYTQQQELGFDFVFRSENGLTWAIWGKARDSNNTYEKFFK